MRANVGKGILFVLFFGGLIGIIRLMSQPDVRHGELVVGTNWIALVTGFLWFVPCWAAVPWLVRLYGGAAALDEDLRKDLDEARAPKPQVDLLVFPEAMRRLAAIGLRGSLQVKSIRRRYGHLALAPWPTLAVVSTLATQSINDAFAAAYEDVQCMVTGTFKNEGRIEHAFICRRSGGEEIAETDTFREFPAMFSAKARRGALGIWLLDPNTIAAHGP
jgi:hypothetical protein